MDIAWVRRGGAHFERHSPFYKEGEDPGTDVFQEALEAEDVGDSFGVNVVEEAGYVEEQECSGIARGSRSLDAVD